MPIASPRVFNILFWKWNEMKEEKRKKDEGKQGQRSSICWLTPPMTMARDGPGQRQEPGAPPRSPTFSHMGSRSLGALQGSRWETEQSGLEPVPIWGCNQWLHVLCHNASHNTQFFKNTELPALLLLLLLMWKEERQTERSSSGLPTKRLQRPIQGHAGPRSP